MEINVVLPERLTGQTANLMSKTRAGSNPAHDVFLIMRAWWNWLTRYPYTIEISGSIPDARSNGRLV